MFLFRLCLFLSLFLVFLFLHLSLHLRLIFIFTRLVRGLLLLRSLLSRAPLIYPRLSAAYVKSSGTSSLSVDRVPDMAPPVPPIYSARGTRVCSSFDVPTVVGSPSTFTGHFGSGRDAPPRRPPTRAGVYAEFQRCLGVAVIYDYPLC